MNKEELEVVNFTNITDEEWTGMWAQEKYVFAPGQTKAFPRFMAEHFCKHLGDRILIDKGQDSSMESSFRKDLVEKMLGKVAVPAQEIYKETTAQEPEFEEVPREEAEVPAELTAEPKKRGRKKVA
jgi:hypothetical protein